MPAYDYQRQDGTVFEAVRPFEERHVATDAHGIKGVLVWRTAPAVRVPIWHQSAPKEDPHTVNMSRRAADPKDPVRVLEPGQERDAERAVKEREARAQHSIDRAVAETLRQHDINVPE